MSDLIALRKQMFATLDELKEDKPLDMDRVRAKTEIYKAIIESAKVEVVFAKTTGLDAPTGFFRSEKLIENSDSASPATGLSDFTRQMGNVTIHRIQG